MNENTLFPPAAPDFSDPIGLLRACHDRIAQHCEILQSLARHIAEKGVDQEARDAAARVHKYFSVAGKHHSQDEEKDLFPRLARQSLKLADLIHRLKQDHEAIDAQWEVLAPLLSRPASIEDNAAFSEQTQKFSDAYCAHIQMENDDLLDMAQHIFSREELNAIGEKMAERRGKHIKLR